MAKKYSSSNKNVLAAILMTVGVFGLGALVLNTQKSTTPPGVEARMTAVCNNRYNPDVTPSNFTTDITNQYLTLPAGRKLVYEGDTEDGRERIEISIAKPIKTKKVDGVTTLVYRDTVWIDADDDGRFENNELHEDVRDYIAQRKDTKDIWYFGEDVNYYEDGRLVGHDGSWLAGRDGAKPGIFVKHNPQRGESFLQECYKGFAEDGVDILSLNADLRTGLGRFTNCVKTLDWNPQEPDSLEHKFYCTQNSAGRQINATVRIVDITNGDRVDLISVTDMGVSNEDDDAARDSGRSLPQATAL